MKKEYVRKTPESEFHRLTRLDRTVCGLKVTPRWQFATTAEIQKISKEDDSIRVHVACK